MASHIDRLLWSTRERLTSDDMNQKGDLHDRAQIEAVAALQSGDLFGGPNPVSGVVAGGLVSPTSPATLSVQVEPLLALLFGAQVPTTYDSGFSWMELKSQVVLDLSASLPLNLNEERWVVIEAEPAEVITAQQNRDFFDPATGAMTTALVTKRKASLPDVTVRDGVPVINPAIAVLPAGVPGKIPLAYVFLRFGDLSIIEERVVRCRPMLRGELTRTTQTLVEPGKGGLMGGVTGGGLATSTPFAIGPEVLVAQDTRAVLGGLEARFTGAVDLTQAHVAFETGLGYVASIQGTTQPLYMYLIAPPYPGGYDALAPRELVFVHTEVFPPGTPRIATPNAHDRLAVGEGDARNCIPLVTLTAPVDLVTSGGIEYVNNRGPHPALLSAPLALDAAGQSWGPGETLDAVYLGTVTHLTPSSLMPQEYKGNGEVRWPPDVVGQPTQQDVQDNSNTGPNVGDFWLASPLTAAGAQLVPGIASAVHVYITQQGVLGTLWGYDFTEDTGPAVDGFTGVGPTFYRSNTWFHTRAFTWSHSESTVPPAASTVTLTVRAYKDRILARR